MQVLCICESAVLTKYSVSKLAVAAALEQYCSYLLVILHLTLSTQHFRTPIALRHSLLLYTARSILVKTAVTSKIAVPAVTALAAAAPVSAVTPAPAAAPPAATSATALSLFLSTTMPISATTASSFTVSATAPVLTLLVARAPLTLVLLGAVCTQSA
jgi:uncharacterized membrane protein